MQCCYPVLLLPSFLTFGLFCNRKLCHFFNWQGLVQHLQAQRLGLEFKTPLLQARAPLSREQLTPLYPEKSCYFGEKSNRRCWTLSSLLRSSFFSWLHDGTRRFTAPEQPSSLRQVRKQKARVCPSVLVSLREGGDRKAGSISRSQSTWTQTKHKSWVKGWAGGSAENVPDAVALAAWPALSGSMWIHNI